MKKIISYKNLIVNPENYRFDPVKNQSEAIDLMLNEKGNEIYNLAEHIAKNGLDPAKDFRVLEVKGGDFIVLDGNRRATAVKCLNDSNLIKDHKFKKAFEAIKIKDKKIEKISCIIYKNEKDAAQWIKLDHTGKNLGTGQESWSAAAKERFGYKFEGKISPSMQMVDLIEKETGKKIDTKKLKISTIDRILSNPTSRSILGVDIKGGVVEMSTNKDFVINNTQKLFDKVIKDDVNVSEVYTKEKNVAFMQDLFEIKIQDDINTDSRREDQSVDNSVASVEVNIEAAKRRTREVKLSDDIFGDALSLKPGNVNNLYLAIVKIYSQNKNDDKTLPIIGMSLRLLLDVVAREHYESVGEQEKANKDQIYKTFLKEAKVNMKKQDVNYLALTNDWLSDEIKLEGLMGKYAHGNITVSRLDVLKNSIVVGEILEFYFKK